MKKFLALISLAVSAFAFTACAPTQEMREGASFEGLTHYYVMPISGGDNFFRQYGTRQTFDDALIEGIKDIMTARGFTFVSNPNEAQFTLHPIYSEWTYANKPNEVFEAHTLDVAPTAARLNQIYLNLEIEAFLPSIEKWAWRNFSYAKIARDNITIDLIKEQAHWCLQHFPPERHPSQTQMDAEAAKPEEVKKN